MAAIEQKKKYKMNKETTIVVESASGLIVAYHEFKIGLAGDNGEFSENSQVAIFKVKLIFM